MILMRHPTTGDTFLATDREANAWEKRTDWRRVDTDKATADELTAAAKAANVRVPAGAPKKVAVEAIEAAGNTGQEG